MTSSSDSTNKNFFKKNRYRSVFFTYIFLMLIFIIFYIFFPLYRTPLNISNLLIQAAPLAIVAIGQAVVLIGGGVDLSIGAVISMTTVIAANFMRTSTSGILIGLVFIFFAAVFVGFLNGLICNESNIPPLIVTLSMSYIIQGIIFWYRSSPGGLVPKEFVNLILYRFGVLSVPIIMVIFIYILFTYIMNRSVFGLYTYSIGESEEFSRIIGINIKKVRIGNYILSATFASIAGLILAARISSGTPFIGNPFTLDSLTGVIIGGVTFAGGQGFVIGALGGSFILGIISNALNISGVSPFYQYILKGSLLVLAMMINSIKKR